MTYTSFIDDEEKMQDFVRLTKEEFLLSYSYLTEEEYELTENNISHTPDAIEINDTAIRIWIG